MSTNHASFSAKNPTPYKGSVTRPETPKAAAKTCTIIEAANYFDLPPLIERHGEWAICEDGIHSLYMNYYIDKARLGEADWIEHVTGKPWVLASEFTAAFERAREIFVMPD